MQILEKLLSTFECYDYGLSKIELFEKWLEKDKNVNKNDVKHALKNALDDNNFDWVSLALRTKFVYKVNEINNGRFDLEDLLIFTDSFNWDNVVQRDAILSFNQKNELKDQFRDINIQDFDSIFKLIIHNNFKWLPFEIKHAYLKHFGVFEYFNQDIIFYLKLIIWDYLFPNNQDKLKLSKINNEVYNLMQSVNFNEGWMEMDLIVKSLNEINFKIDLFDLSKIEWSINIQHKQHYRNPFTLGFKRFEPKI